MIQKNRWGAGTFSIAVVFIAIAYSLSHFNSSIINNHRIFTYSGVIFSFCALFCGHFSYPRVHNLKVYLIGYLTGLAGIFLFILNHPLLEKKIFVSPQGLFGTVIIVLFLNCILFLAVPSFVKYRITRSITLAIFTVEAIFLGVTRFIPAASDWVVGISSIFFQTPCNYAGFVVFAIVCISSFFLLRHDFYLGGLISGLTLIYAVIWKGGIDASHLGNIQMLLLAGAPLYVIIGIMVHWFSRLDHRIAYDPLLQIYNRDFCSKIISEQSNIKTVPPFTVAMVDIDHFKNVNDTYGHQAGDAVLHSIAQAVSRGVVPAGIACRYGGEELAVFFPQRKSKEVHQIMEKVRSDIENIKTQSGKKQIKVTISCGIAQREDISQSIMDVINTADKALYRAKKGGRNQVKSGKVPLDVSKQ